MSALTADAVVRLLYQAFEVRDLTRIGTLLSDEAEWVDTTSSGRAVGRDAVLALLADEVRESGGSFALRLQQLYTDDDGHAVAFHEVTDASGQVHTRCLLFEVTDGRVGRVQGLAAVPSGRLGRG
ncbi:MAG: nuclear transport factor 2 family protein [Jatrophihabitantaceae bacterium]